MFLWFEEKSIKLMVLKNLMANRERNRLTTIIYSLGLGFIIFLHIAQKVQIQTPQLHELRLRAGYLQVSNSFDLQYSQVQVDHTEDAMYPRLIEPVLEANQDLIDHFTWIPRELGRLEDLRIKNTFMSDYSRQSSHDVGIYGVQPSLLKATQEEMKIFEYENKTSKLSSVEQLYTPRGSQGMGVGSILPSSASIDILDHTQTMILDIFSDFKNRVYQLRPLFTMKLSPGFTMTDMDLNVDNKQTVLMSVPMYATLAQKKISEIPQERLVIKLKDYKNKEKIEYVKQAIKKHFEEIGYKPS